MSPNYSEYSEKELLEALNNIDQESHPENYKNLKLELSTRHRSNCQNLSPAELSNLVPRTQDFSGNPSSLKRIFFVLSLGFLGAIPSAMSIDSQILLGSDFIYLLLISLIFALPLIHSFITGRTISTQGVISRQHDNFYFTVSQIFYSFCFFISVLALVAR